MKEQDHNIGSARTDGNVLIGVLISLMMLAGLATPMLLRALRARQSTTGNVLSSRLLAVTESGLHYNYSFMEKDELYCVKDTVTFTLHAASKEYRSPELLLNVNGEPQKNTFSIGVKYLDTAGNPVVFANRAAPTEEFKTVKVTSRARTSQVSREISAYYEFRLAESFRGALISDKVPVAYTTGKSKNEAKKGNLVLRGDGKNQRHTVFGDIKANGVIMYDGASDAELTTANLATYMAATRGEAHGRLGATLDEIPDFTVETSNDQLFDFGRFHAAAAAGAGAVYTSIASFESAMSAANGTGDKLEGIQVILIDQASEGPSPRIDVAGGINVTGTLMFLFAAGTSVDYELEIRCGLNVNAADLTGVTFTDEATLTTAYPPNIIDVNKRPWSVDITGAGYDNFVATDDLPAVMSNNAILDMECPINVCGVFYSAGFLDIDNEHSGHHTMYFNGTIIGGNGIWIEADKDVGSITIRHDTSCTDQLAVSNRKGLRLLRTGYMIAK